MAVLECAVSGNYIFRSSPSQMVLAGEGGRSTNDRRAVFDPYLYVVLSLRITSCLAGRRVMLFVSKLQTSRFFMIRPLNLNAVLSKVNEMHVSPTT